MALSEGEIEYCYHTAAVTAAVLLSLGFSWKNSDSRISDFFPNSAHISATDGAARIFSFQLTRGSA